MREETISKREALTVTSAGVIWKVRDYQHRSTLFKGRGLLVPVGPYREEWNALEAFSDPAIAAVRVLGSHAWVQLEPTLAAGTVSPLVPADISRLLAKVVEGRMEPWYVRCVRAAGCAPLLVCVPLAVPGIPGWVEVLPRPAVTPIPLSPTSPDVSATAMPAMDVTLELPLLRNHRVRRAGMYALALIFLLGLVGGGVLAVGV